MVSKQVMIQNESGLHARPASEFVSAASRFAAHITIRAHGDSESANAKSIVMLLSLGLNKGTLVEITAEGEDEQQALDTLVALIEGGFGE